MEEWKQDREAHLTDHPVVKDFQSIFDQYPQLYDALSRETNAEAEDGFQEQSTMKRKTADSIPTTPKKQRFAEDRSSPFLKHQMLDASIAKLIDTDVLTSPSKRFQKSKLQVGGQSIHDSVLLENAYRMFGMTTFPVVDPSDLKLNDETKETQIGREMIGIRLEVFNERLAKYEKPFYILLKKKVKSDVWSLFKYTVPQYIDVQALFNNTNGGMVASYNAIYLFAKEVYKQLIQLSHRLQELQQLEGSKKIANLDVDLEAASVSFKQGRTHFRLLLHKDKIVSCSVRGDTIDARTRSQHETFFLGSLGQLRSKLAHFDQE